MRTVLTVFLIICCISNASSKEVTGNLRIGQQIPDELGVDLNGEKVKASDHLGKLIVISFWATWCPPCRRELPIIDNLQRIVGKDKLSVFAVNFGESRRTYKKFIKQISEANLTFTHDKKGRTGKKVYGIKGIPHMVIVNHEGKIAQIHSGYGDETLNNLVDEMNTLLRKQAEYMYVK